MVRCLGRCAACGEHRFQNSNLLQNQGQNLNQDATILGGSFVEETQLEPS